MLKKGDSVRGYKVLEKFVPGKNVFLVSDASNKNFALKVLEGGILNNEAKIGMTIKSPFLVRIYEMITSEENDIYLIIEYCEEGDLSKQIGKKNPPTEMEIYRFTYESIQAVSILHKAGVIHRDIKPSNFFLIKGGGYKLGDYGVACVLNPSSSNTMTYVGSNGYISPEIMEGKRAYTNKVDIYSLGITLLEFILGQHPFSNDNGVFNMFLAMKGVPNEAALNHPHPCAKLALKMIASDPALRPSADEVLATDVLAVSGFFLKHIRRTEEDRGKMEMEMAQLKKELAAGTAAAAAAAAVSPPPAAAGAAAKPTTKAAAAAVVQAPAPAVSEFVWSETWKAPNIEVLNGGRTVKVISNHAGSMVLCGQKKLTGGIATLIVKIMKGSNYFGYALGVVTELPKTFQEGFGRNHTQAGMVRIPGWGLSRDCNQGICYLGKTVVNSRVDYGRGDAVTMVVDVNKGDLVFSVNGKKCAELRNEAGIRAGVYLAAQMWEEGVEWTIITSKYKL